MRRYQKILFPVLFFLSVFDLLCAEEIFTWQECIREAAKNNPDLIAAQEEIKQSEAGKKITASSLYPQVDASLSASTDRTDTGSANTIADFLQLWPKRLAVNL